MHKKGRSRVRAPFKLTRAESLKRDILQDKPARKAA